MTWLGKALVRAWQVEHMCREVGQHQIVVDRRDLVEPRLAELALDIIFVDKAVAAMGVEAGIGGRPTCLRREQLGHVGLGAALLALVEQPGGLVAHQIGGGHGGIGAGERELYALVAPDRRAEHYALPRIGGRALDEPVAVADTLGGQQDALGVPTIDDIAEAAPLLANQAIERQAQVAIPDLVGLVVKHRTDALDLGRAGLFARLAQVDQEQAEATGPVADLLAWGGARQQEQQIGLLDAAGPVLVAVHPILVAIAPRCGADAGRVRAGLRFGDGERLQPQLAACNLRQPAIFLLRAAMAQQRTHDVYLGVERRRVAARAIDLFQHDAGLGDAQAQAAILFRNERREVAGAGERLDKLPRIGALAIGRAPVQIGKTCTELSDAHTQLFLFRGQLKVHLDPRKLFMNLAPIRESRQFDQVAGALVACGAHARFHAPKNLPYVHVVPRSRPAHRQRNDRADVLGDGRCDTVDRRSRALRARSSAQASDAIALVQLQIADLS